MNNNNANRTPNRQPQRPRPSSPSQQNKSGINLSYNTICLVACFALLIVNLKVFSMIVTGNESLDKKIAVTSVSDEEQARINELERLKKDVENNFTPISLTADDTKRGTLILVDAKHEYDFDAVSTLVVDEQAVAIPDSADASYWVKSNYDLLKPEVLAELDRLLSDFAKECNNTDVMIFDTYRSFEDQQRVLNNKITELGEQEGRKIATEPGFSEHHTCLALDLTLFNGTEYSDYDGSGIYKWITDNCYKYGFVIRYPSDKTHITGISYEPWHLRYVGYEHAYYMTQNGLCLEEYVELLSGLSVDENRLQFTCDNGESYTVYSSSVSETEKTVLVPKNGTYTLSGDNNGRIIVSCKSAF